MSFRHFKRYKQIYYTYIIYIMSEEFEIFKTDINNWNYIEFINKTGIDPYNN